MSPSHKRFPCPSWRCLYCLWCLVVWIPNYLTRSWSSLVWTGRYQSIEVFSASVVASVGNDSIREHPAICIECLGWLCIEKYIQANQTVLIALHTGWFFFSFQIMWQIENMRLREIFFFFYIYIYTDNPVSRVSWISFQEFHKMQNNLPQQERRRKMNT